MCVCVLTSKIPLQNKPFALFTQKPGVSRLPETFLEIPSGDHHNFLFKLKAPFWHNLKFWPFVTH